jgi:hypothetical protein
MVVNEWWNIARVFEKLLAITCFLLVYTACVLHCLGVWRRYWSRSHSSPSMGLIVQGCLLVAFP